MSRIKTLMKTLSHATTLAAALVLTLVLFASAGCQRKELLEPHDHFNLIINASFDELVESMLIKAGVDDEVVVVVRIEEVLALASC